MRCEGDWPLEGLVPLLHFQDFACGAIPLVPPGELVRLVTWKALVFPREDWS